LIEQTKEANKSTAVEQQNSQQEDDKKQGQHVFTVVDNPATGEQEVLQIIDNAAATGQDPKHSENEEEEAHTAPQTMTEEVKLQNMFLQHIYKKNSCIDRYAVPFNYFFVLQQPQQIEESTDIQHQQKQPEETIKQGEQDIPTVDRDGTHDQAQNTSLNKQEIAGARAATTTEKVKLHKLLYLKLKNSFRHRHKCIPIY
jgi:hypothetical protein